MSTPLQNPVGGTLTTTAPWYRVPPKAVVSVEHPCLVKNVDKAIAMLGGSTAVAETVMPHSDGTLGLRFCPEDKASRTIISFNNQTKNVLFRITVPKRTGRKRKRGVDEPFVEVNTEDSTRKDARYLLRSMSDSLETYEVEPVGSIQSTHVWRAMPDFVYSTTSSDFLNNFRSKIIPEQYPLIKQWDLPRTYGLTDTETVPPPVFSTVAIPNNYSYRQNPAVKQVTDTLTGQKVLHNTQAPIKIWTHQCQWDSPVYPSLPPNGCPPLSSQPINLQRLADKMSALFLQRPLWTRRALLNHLPSTLPLFLARYAIAYVAFAIRSGPWRDTYCALGHDPRKSADYRKYQTILLQLVPKLDVNNDMRNEFQRKWSRSRDTASHIFSGSGRIPEDGKVWQLCDITDTQLKSLVDISDACLRADCEARYFGWYLNGTTAKMRVILKAKTDALTYKPPDFPDPPEAPLGWVLETPGELDHSLYEPFLSLPEEWYAPTKDKEGKIVEDAMHGYIPSNKAHKNELEWASAYRSMCRCPPGSVPQGAYRLSKTKPDARPSFISTPPTEDRESEGTGVRSTEHSQTLRFQQEINDAEDDGLAGYEEPADDEEDDDPHPDLNPDAEAVAAAEAEAGLGLEEEDIPHEAAAGGSESESESEDGGYAEDGAELDVDEDMNMDSD